MPASQGSDVTAASAATVPRSANGRSAKPYTRSISQMTQTATAACRNTSGQK